MEQIDLLKQDEEIESSQRELARLIQQEEVEQSSKVRKSRIATLKDSIASLFESKTKREARLSASRESCQKEAEKLFPEAVSSDKRVKKLIHDIRLREQVYQLCTPLRRKQISASKSVWITRIIKEKKATGIEQIGRGDIKGPPSFSEVETKQRMMVELYKLDRFLEDGWHLEPPDQDTEPEPLTGENSILVPSIDMAKIFEEARDFFGQSYFENEPSQKEIDEFLKGLK